MQDGLKDTATGIRGDKKRKLPIMVESEDQKKKNKPSPASPGTPAPHDALLAELRTKYDILPAFTISSTKIHKRVTWLLLHLRKNDGDARKRAVLLYARLDEVGKMITISEQVKRIVAEEDGGRWYQYNKMYELPPKAEVVEETMLDGGRAGNDTDDDDDFEVMESRFEKAVMPQPKKGTPKSLSIFLSLEPMPELKAQEGVTQQTNET
ncbi:hypothetical protein COL154_010750 [Colletotrichum chrysophilum]|uniref:DNA/RNA-binding protein Alba-like domain-containing protein n=1 Tax=Colletotrichum chrysophilum TaxID=1836956 RepID=A0AAD9ASP8_9PEZI|nr:uncharacterized protein COL26b_011375 [Colletotrichum chrysophilum]KAJ0343604.1 hypothetical protein KNSL1_010155 [Colletotrichum chrysophilum]KAJ0356796.1 hypothetical protein COL154_010750 [Colletotrichum chrysophilum]KAJ0367148.1 hypothetical protein COL26b_011375 [Colletotrichum chrysophilum]KAK1852457.1 hypothetical protein CCHR01_04902 [Colletotrichum chrysophilum]